MSALRHPQSAQTNRHGSASRSCRWYWLTLLLMVLAPLFFTACGGGMKTASYDSGAPNLAPGEKAALDAMPGMPAGQMAKEKNADFNTEQYDRIFENPFMLAAKEPLSTFSIDVDTASYSNVRRFLSQQKKLPPKDAVRIEELINYFDYDYPEPKGEHPIEISTEVAACPWDGKLKLVRIGLQAKDFAPEELPQRNFVFLLDTSGSMDASDRLPLLKKSLELLIDKMRVQDRIAIVAYSGSAGLVLESTAGDNKAAIRAALGRLNAGGSTNGGEGIQLAYKVAQENFIKDGINRVIIGSDGDFNVGTTSRGELIRLIEEKRKSGIYLSVLGFGRGNLHDATMESLAQHGNGRYSYIDSIAEAQKIFIEQASAMYTLANDVKVQVEFNPSRVHAYRLVGYENRLMANQDFNDETKDAGDLGAGHRVTALYVVAPPGVKVDIPKIDPLKYQKKPDLTPAAKGDDLLTVKIRYKNIGAAKSKLLVHPVKDATRKFSEASTNFRFAAAVAEFGLLLRDSKYKGSASYDGVIRMVQDARGQDRNGHRSAFIELAEVAQNLTGGQRKKE